MNDDNIVVLPSTDQQNLTDLWFKHITRKRF